MVIDSFDSIISNVDFGSYYIGASFKDKMNQILIENFPKIHSINKKIATTFENYERSNFALFEEYNGKNTYLVGTIQKEKKSFLIIEPGINKCMTSDTNTDLDEIKCLRCEYGNSYSPISTILRIQKNVLVFERISDDQTKFECYDKETLEYIFNNIKFENKNYLFMDRIEECIKSNNICPDVTFNFWARNSGFNYTIYKSDKRYYGEDITFDTHIDGWYILYKSIFNNINISDFLEKKDLSPVVQKIKSLNKSKK